MKILNLYAGLGGNRKHWKGHEITSVELNPTIAKYYQDQYKNDKVIVGDAHDYLLNHYQEFDLVWSSVSCPTHSRARFWASKPNKKVKPVFPDMKLYEEILFLKHYFDGDWIVENVIPYYKPLIEPSIKIGRHLFWSNKMLMHYETKEADIKNGNLKEWQELHGIDISGYKFNTRKDQLLRNCVHPDLGLHILNSMLYNTQ